MGVAKATTGRVANRPYILVAVADAASGSNTWAAVKLWPAAASPNPPPHLLIFFNVTVDFQLLKASRHHDMQIGFLKKKKKSVC